MRGAAHAFSLIELVIVVVIIGVIGAIAVPRLSRGSEGATEAQFIANLNILRTAIDRFAVEHEGLYPAADNDTFVKQMTMYSDMHGSVSATISATHLYGPYLRKMPRIPVGPYRGRDEIVDAAAATLGDPQGAWYYDRTQGTVRANLQSVEKTIDGRALNAL